MSDSKEYVSRSDELGNIHISEEVLAAISAAAALTAERMCPGCADYMLASHVSAEPAGAMVLTALGLKPVIQAGMCLGEGTGAVASLPLFQMAADVYSQMSTFQENSIEEYQEFSHA